MSTQNVIDTILRGGTDEEIIEAALQQTRYDAINALRMMSAARGSGTIATVLALNTIGSIDSPDGSPQPVTVTGTVIPETTGVTFVLMQAGEERDRASVVPSTGGVLSHTFTVAVGTGYYVSAEVPATPDFQPVTSNTFAVNDLSAKSSEPLPELLPNLTYAA